MMPLAFRAFLVAAAAFLALDAVWLTAMGPRLYRPLLGPLMRADPDLLAAAAFYVVYLMGLVHFAVLTSRSARQALVQGGAFGFIAYATYDLTNQATLVAWSWQVTAADLAWGTFASSVATTVAWHLAGRRGR